MRLSSSARALAAAGALAVVLTACSGSSGGAAPATSPTPTSSAPVDGPSASTGPPARQIRGYTIAPVSEAARGTFEGLVTGSQGALKNVSAYKVTKGSTDVGGLVIFDVDPTTVIGPEAAETLTTALVKTLSGQSTVTSKMFGGLRVVTATGDGTTVSAWFNGDVTSVVIGADAATIKDFVDASIVG